MIHNVRLRTAVVILNHDDDKNALSLASSMESFSCIDEVVIADNSAGDGVKAVPSGKIYLIRIKNRGYAAGNNEAVKFAEKLPGGCDIVFIANPDVSVSEDSVLACIDFLAKNNGYAAVAPRMKTMDGDLHHLTAWTERSLLCDIAYSSGILSRTIGMYRECYPPEHWEKPAADVDCLNGSFFAVKTKALERAGYFDEHTFLYYEEDILGFKLKRLGYKSAVLTRFYFTHCEGASVNRSVNILKRYLIMQRSRLYFQKKYKKVSLPGYLALCAATGLGTVEKFIKLMYHSIVNLHVRNIHIDDTER